MPLDYPALSRFLPRQPSNFAYLNLLLSFMRRKAWDEEMVLPREPAPNQTIKDIDRQREAICVWLEISLRRPVIMRIEPDAHWYQFQEFA